MDNEDAVYAYLLEVFEHHGARRVLKTESNLLEEAESRKQKTTLDDALSSWYYCVASSWK